jgi:hypothetical protein
MPGAQFRRIFAKETGLTAIVGFAIGLACGVILSWMLVALRGESAR